MFKQLGLVEPVLTKEKSIINIWDLPSASLRDLRCGAMERPQQDPGRKSLPHLSSLQFPNQSIIQYVTVCVDKRRKLLARPEIHQLLLESWRRADHWLVGRYVIMPDHLHLFCAPAKFPPAPLKDWMKFWRADATRLWPHVSEKPIWQKDFFDRQLRSGESYREKWMYVWENPMCGKTRSRQVWCDGRRIGRSAVR